MKYLLAVPAPGLHYFFSIFNKSLWQSFIDIIQCIYVHKQVLIFFFQIDMKINKGLHERRV